MGLFTLVAIFLMVVSFSLAGLHTTFLGATEKKDDAFFQSLSLGDSYDFVIITPSDFSRELQPLVPHKESHGIKTKIVTLDEIYNGKYFSVEGRDDPEKIKYFIKNATEDWGIKYVLLVGNRDQMPVRYSNPYFTLLSRFNNKKDRFITDLYYADIYFENTDNFCSWDSSNNDLFGEIDKTGLIDEVDLYPDVYIGRILCSSPKDVNFIVDKIIVYENTSYQQAWFNNFIVCGGNTHWWDRFIDSPVEWEGEYLGDKIIENVSECGFNVIKLYASAIYSREESNTDVLTKNNIYDAINDGAGFVIFSGHGTRKSFSTYPPFLNFWPLPLVKMPPPLGFLSSDIKNFDNAGKYHILVLDTCSGADFSKNIIHSPIAWDFVNLENGGAIASYANTRPSWSSVGTMAPETLGGYLITHMFQVYSEGKNNGMDKTGILFAEAIRDYVDNLDGKKDGPYFCQDVCAVEFWELFGDPTLQIGGYPP